MKILPRRWDPTDGESLVAVHPPMAPDADGGWHRRLNLTNGRSLSHLALTSEQEGLLRSFDELVSKGGDRHNPRAGGWMESVKRFFEKIS